MFANIEERIQSLVNERNAIKRPSKKYFADNGWEDQYLDAMRQYYQDCQDIDNQLKELMLEDLGWAGKPGADDLYEYVRREHSPSGWYDVYFYLKACSMLVETVIAKQKG